MDNKTHLCQCGPNSLTYWLISVAKKIPLGKPVKKSFNALHIIMCGKMMRWLPELQTVFQLYGHRRNYLKTTFITVLNSKTLNSKDNS